MDLIIRNLPSLLGATQTTLLLTAACLMLGTSIGLIAGISSTLRIRSLRYAVGVYVYIIRGIPLLVQLFFMYYFLPFLGVELKPAFAAVTTISVFIGALITEVVRGAIESIPKGLIDAARSLGMGTGFRLRKIVLPQAIVQGLPSYVSVIVMLVKLTSLVSLLSMMDLMGMARAIVERTMAPFSILLPVAGIYFSICFVLSKIGRRIERRFSYLH